MRIRVNVMKRVAVVMGGTSNEREVSLKTGAACQERGQDTELTDPHTPAACGTRNGAAG